MHLSALLSSLPLDFEAALRQAVDLGFTHVDVVALAERSESYLTALAESGLLVACASLGRGLPEDHMLDAAAVAARRQTLELLKRQLADAARLGATCAYLIPGTDGTPEGLARFTEGCTLLADYAAGRKVRLCVEHFPGRALPTAAGTLDWLECIGHPNLALLLDVGHCLISGEDAVEVVRRAGTRLGYVHFDDNDSVNDLHWPLLQGRLTPDMLRAVLDALGETGYRDAVSLELNPRNPDPVKGLREGKEILLEMLANR